MVADKQTNMPISSGFAADDTIAGQKLSFYWRVTRGLILLLLILEIVIMVVNQYLYLHWVAEPLIFFILSWVLIKKYKVRLNTLVAASIFLGVIAGFLLAIFEIIWYHQWWYLFDLIRLPILLSIEGFIVSVILTLIFKSLLKNKV